jgi:FMN phosphatase YigB (HAD superfamily)
MNTFLNLCKNYDAVGFDLDGTLYDEFSFISDFYHSLGIVFKCDLKKGAKNFACRTWLKFGSEYSFLFQDLYCKYYTGKMSKSEFVNKCLFDYRIFKPNIKLSMKSKKILQAIKKKKLFLITDGNSNLQLNKIKALKLKKYICEENIFLTGKLGKSFYKPCRKIIEKSNIMKVPKVIFFGDRLVDKKFALRCGFDFKYVKNMKLLNKN